MRITLATPHAFGMPCVQGAAFGRADETAVTAREWLLVSLAALFTAIGLLIPYLLGYILAPPSSEYTGILVNVEDSNYLTAIRRGAEGYWTHSLRFTSEPDSPAFLYVFYLGLGHLARLCGLTGEAMWHLSRVLLTFVLVLVTYGFVSHFLVSRPMRAVAFVLAVFGAGFDWLPLPFEQLDLTSATPVDLKMPDAHLFYSALTFPHYAASITLLMVIFWCASRLTTEEMSRGKLLLVIILGMAADAALALVYPFFVLLSGGVLALYWLIQCVRARRPRWREGIRLTLLLAPLVPLVLYYYAVLESSELLRRWAEQSQTLSPNPLHYILAFSPYLALALWGLRRDGLGSSEQADQRALLWSWVLAVAILVYAPLAMQRRFLQGVQAPLAVLATIGLVKAALPWLENREWFRRLARRPGYSASGLQRLFVIGLVLLVSASSVYQWTSAVLTLGVLQPYPLFRSRAELAAMDWLDQNAGSEDVVLAAYYTGSLLPSRSGTRVYIGHLYETIAFDAKQSAVERFFDSETSDHHRRSFLASAGIDYVFYGRAERALGQFNPDRAAFLETVFRNDEVTIYRVEQ